MKDPDKVFDRLTKEKLTRSERRREARLKKLPKDRRCPFCGHVRVDLNRWVIKPNAVGCRSCSNYGRF